MKERIISLATWFCRSCEGLPSGSDLIVAESPEAVVVVPAVGRSDAKRVYQFPGPKIDERLLRCPYCGSADLSKPESAE